MNRCLPLLAPLLLALLLAGCSAAPRKQAADYIAQGNYGLAEPYLREALDHYSLDHNAYLLLGQVYRHTGRTEQARLVFQQIAANDPPAYVLEETDREFAGRPVAELANHYLEQMGEGPMYRDRERGTVVAPPSPLSPAPDRPDTVAELEQRLLASDSAPASSQPYSGTLPQAAPSQPYSGTLPPAAQQTAQQAAPMAQPPLVGNVRYDIPPGNAFGVHVLSFERALSLEGGREELLRRFPDIFAGKEFRSRRVDLGAKGVWHRLLSGPYGTRADAARDCARLKKTYGYCEVVPF